MKIYKQVNIYYAILRDTIVKTPDTINSFLIAILKLSEIQNVNKPEITKIFGFSEDFAEILLDRLIYYNYIRRIDSNTEEIYEITKNGNNLLENGDQQIYFEKQIDLRLKMTISPHFILSNHWFTPPRSDIDINSLVKPVIKLTDIITRRQVSGLHKSIERMVYPPEIISVVDSHISFFITEDPPTEVFITEYNNKRRSIALNEDDPTLKTIHESLWKLLKPKNRFKTFKELISEKEDQMTFLKLELVKSESENLLLEIESKSKEISMEDIISWIDWLKANNWNFTSIVLSFTFEDNWKTDLNLQITVKNQRLICGMFAQYLVQKWEDYQYLIWENGVRVELAKIWDKFLQKFGVKANLEYKLLEDILWVLDVQGKIFASKILEEEVF